MFKFTILKQSKKSRARVGKITTPHGEIITPAFIPVATLGVIKGGLDFSDTEKTKVQCQITNTFHFLDLDQDKLVAKADGLHKFFNFNKPIFTDSGGFQVFSLGKGAEFGIGKIQSIFPGDRNKFIKTKNSLVNISEVGAKFRSPRDGRLINLTPELSAQTQINLGADFMYLLDICGSVTDNAKITAADTVRTERWYKRFLAVKIPKHQKTFGIIQGGSFKDIRLKATDSVNNLPTFGIAIGGALGKDRQEMTKIISWINEKIDWSRPHHLLGIGDLESIPKIIDLGVDLFDCAMPTRIARHGTALTSKGYLSIAKGALKNKFQPIEKNCQCLTCQNYSLAQLNFLAKAKEMLAGKLLTIHNLFYIETWLEKIRDSI